MSEAVLLWVGGILFTLLFMVASGAITFVLKYVVDTLKALSGEIQLNTKETQGRLAVLELSLKELQTKHEMIHDKCKL